MKGSENYHEIRKQINLFFDNELKVEDKQHLLDRVGSDPKCQNMFAKEKNFREYIKNNYKRPTVSSSLLTNIKNSIKTKE